MKHFISDHDKNLETPTMLYKYPGPHKIDDGYYDYCIVDASEVENKIKEGWSKTIAEAKNSKTEKKNEKKEISEEEVKDALKEDSEAIFEKPKKRGRKKA